MRRTGRGKGKDIQGADGEYGAQCRLPTLADLQLPDDAHWQEEDCKIQDHVGHGGADQIRGEVYVVGTFGYVFEVRGPEESRWGGLEDRGEKDGNAPADDECEHHVYRLAERRSHTEEPQVEHKNGAFDCCH